MTNFVLIISFVFRDIRSKNGGGKVRMTKTGHREFPPITKDSKGKPKMEFGDHRSRVHPCMTTLVTIFLRNHNHIAENLEKIHQDWSDEKLFQEAKKINTAVYQNIVYTQFLNALLGKSNNATLDNSDSYNPEVDGTIQLVFSTAAYRYFIIILFIQAGWGIKFGTPSSKKFHPEK